MCMQTEPGNTGNCLKEEAYNSGMHLRRIEQQSIDLYEGYLHGELLYVSIAEVWDDPERWSKRTAPETNAMIVLALDEYHGHMNWQTGIAGQVNDLAPDKGWNAPI
jgi:hypothetical protein